MEIAIIDKTKKTVFPIKCYKHEMEAKTFKDKNPTLAQNVPLADFYVTRETKDGSQISVPLCGDCTRNLCALIDTRVLHAAIAEQEMLNK